MLERFAVLFVVAFVVGLGPEKGTFPDWRSLRVRPSLDAVRASLEKSGAKVPIWKDVQPKMRSYMEPVARAAVKLVPETLQKPRDEPKVVPKEVLRSPLVERQAPMTEASTTASTFGPVGSEGDEVGDVLALLPPSEGSDLVVTPDTPGISDIPDIVVNKERNDTVFTFRFQYRLRQAKNRRSTVEP